MSTSTNKAIVRQYVQQMLNGGSYDNLEEYMSDDIVLHGTDLPPGIEALKAWFTTFKAAFPDQQTSLDDLVAEGDRVVMRVTLSGTHLGDIEGIPATGNKVTQSSITIYRLANGKIVEGWFSTDNLKMMQQLGVIPTPEAV